MFNGKDIILVAAGFGSGLVNGGQIGYSTDGLTWQKATLNDGLFSGGDCYNITYDATQRQWVAAGQGLKDANLEISDTNPQVGQIGYSTDGMNWQKAILNNGLFSGGGGYYSNGNCNNITYDATQRQWVAAGQGLKDANLEISDNNPLVGQIGYSTDGITWQKATLNNDLFSGGGGGSYSNGICYNITYDATQRQWVASGYGLKYSNQPSSYDNPIVGQLGYSTDGLTWQKAILNNVLFNGGGEVFGRCNNITYDATQRQWVAAGYGLKDGTQPFSSTNAGVGQIGYSKNGINWTKANLKEDLFSGGGGGGSTGSSANNGSCNNITYDTKERLLVAAGSGLKDATEQCTFTNPQVGQIGYSTDGITWQKANLNDGLFSGGGGSYYNGDCFNITYDATKRQWVAAGYGLKNANLENSDTNPRVGQIGYSTDGITWQKATLNDGLFSGGGGDYFFNGYCINITYDANQRQWVASGSGLKDANQPSSDNNPLVGQIGYSTDGMTWQKATLKDGLFSGGGCNNIIYCPPPPPPIVTDICFVGGSKVTTDQGLISIENITTKHTIRGKPVQHVTRTISKDNYLILIKQGALGANKPCVDTRVSKDHKIDVKGKLVEAYRLINLSRQIKKIKYSGELLYNVLLADKGTMIVNNLRCETLDPKNKIALLYNGLDKTTKTTTPAKTPHKPIKHTLVL